MKIITTTLLALTMYTPAHAFWDIDLFSSPTMTKEISIDKNEGKVVSEFDFKASTQEALMHETVIKDSEYLKDHYQEIILVLRSFSSLERNLNGYEEKKVVTSLKNFFKDKYLINQTDLIQIKTNLNEVIK